MPVTFVETSSDRKPYSESVNPAAILTLAYQYKFLARGTIPGIRLISRIGGLGFAGRFIGCFVMR